MYPYPRARARSVIGMPCQCARTVLENPLSSPFSYSALARFVPAGGRVRRPGTCVQDDLRSRSNAAVDHIVLRR